MADHRAPGTGAALTSGGVLHRHPRLRLGLLLGPPMLWLGVLCLALSGAADMVSAAYRSTMLQVAAPDELRGRLQGVFIVVVAGGPRAGDFLAGSVASSVGERVALVLGGLACIAGVLLAVTIQRRFLAYDALNPQP